MQQRGKKGNTDDLLAASFKELLCKAPMEKITIKDITDKAGVIRPTFYNHFADKYALLEYIVRHDLLEPIKPLGNGGDLLLVGNAGTGLNVALLLDEDSRGRGLGDKAKGTVGIHGDDHGDDQAHVILGALVEFLGKGSDVDAVLTQGRANGGCGSCFARGDLQFDVSNYFLCHL